MLGLKTYRNYLLYNKFLDMITYLIVLTLFTLFFLMIYYTTKSIVVLCITMILLYFILMYILKLFEIKTLIPTIIYIVVSLSIILLVYFNETEQVNSDIVKMGIISAIILSLILIIISLHKYETPIALYYKIKDSLSGISYGKKIKTKYKNEENITTDTPYSNNLLFEKTKLLNKLGEDYKEEYTKVDYELTKAKENQQRNEETLKDLEDSLKSKNERFKKATTGAQKFELTNQMKEVKEKIQQKKEEQVDIISKVNLSKNKKEELENTYAQDIFYISNAYNLRYRNYTDKVLDKIVSTNKKIEVIPFDLIKMEGLK